MANLLGKMLMALVPFIAGSFRGGNGLFKAVLVHKFVLFTLASNLILFVLFVFMVEQTVYLLDKAAKHKEARKQCEAALVVMCPNANQ